MKERNTTSTLRRVLVNCAAQVCFVYEIKYRYFFIYIITVHQFFSIVLVPVNVECGKDVFFGLMFDRCERSVKC
jgi:hypothetical protein